MRPSRILPAVLLAFGLVVATNVQAQQTCEAKCNQQALGGCWCDEACDGFGDCCADVCVECPGLSHCDPGGGTCAGQCGGQSPQGCWCDEACGNLGDCCPGVCDECPALGHCPPVVVPTCGDGTCDASEDCLSCAADCGACPALCGDGTCDASETCSGCAADCGACPPLCGNGTCDPSEDCVSCATDCGACPPPTCPAVVICGDDLLNHAREECDGGAMGTPCDGQCLSDCTCPAGPFCGDDEVQGSEECDGEAEGTPCDGQCLGNCTCATCPQFPASGQTTARGADKNDGFVGDVSVPDDGMLEAGATLAYVDNEDGTITDLNTGLMWEKKDRDGGLHDMDNIYRWSGDGSQETIWDWLDDINTEGGGFAGHSDWRIPNVKELQSIIHYERSDPAVDPDAFNTDCFAPCTVTTCSCTRSSSYWSSTTDAFDPANNAFNVGFGGGRVVDTIKDDDTFVRAVRGP